MKLLTSVELPENKGKINYDKSIMFVGSCFTENIGKKFYDLFFDVLINPYGVLYNPVSIAISLTEIIQKKHYSEKDLVQRNGLWHSFMHHSTFSSKEKNLVLDKINHSIEQANNFLLSADLLFITFGTAWIYVLKKSGKIVGNNHKFPANYFERKLLDINHINKIYTELITELQRLNPKIEIIFTVSPVRHLKDGLHGNTISKSVLHLAIKKITDNNETISYFPSYEIVNDELRDYRFYATDMTHLSELAVDYIFEKMILSFFDTQTSENLKITKKLQKCLSHKIMNQANEDISKFFAHCQKLLKQCSEAGKKIAIKRANEMFNTLIKN